MPYLSTLLQIDFDENPLQALYSNGDWAAETEDDNTIYCLTGDESFRTFAIGDSAWQNYSVEMRVRFRDTERGHAAIITRLGERGSGYRHSISISRGGGGVGQYYYEENLWRGFGNLNLNVTTDRWYVLRAEVEDVNVRTFVDELLASISVSILAQQGIIAFEGGPNTNLCLDDIIVRSLDTTAGISLEQVRSLTSVNVRSAPGLSEPIVGGLRSGQEVLALDESGAWTYIRVATTGVQGWVFSQFLEPV